MKVKCIDNNLCSTLTLNKEYSVVEEATEDFVIRKNSKGEIKEISIKFKY